MRVVTLTGNLLAEWTFEMEDAPSTGATQRARSMSFQVGGKGINVARILKRLGAEALALGFADGPLADLCAEWLTARGLEHALFPLGSGVRPGLVVRAPETAGGAETTFLGTDLPVPAASWKAACQRAAQERPDWLAVCGSIPGWRASWTAQLRDLRAGVPPVRVAVDTYGAPLKDLSALPLDLVKINRSELDRLLPECAGQPAGEALARAMDQFAPRNWIVTDGPRPLLAAFADGSRLELLPAAIPEASPTGSGDTFLAAFLHAWQPGKDSSAALAHAGACASANAASAGIGDFPLPVPQRFMPEVRPLA